MSVHWDDSQHWIDYSDGPQWALPKSINVAGLELQIVDRYPLKSSIPYHVVTRSPELWQLAPTEYEASGFVPNAAIAFAIMLLRRSLARCIDDGSEGLLAEASFDFLYLLTENLHKEGLLVHAYVPFDQHRIKAMAGPFAAGLRHRLPYLREIETMLRMERTLSLCGPWLHRNHPQIALSAVDHTELPEDEKAETVQRLMEMGPHPVVSYRVARDYIRIFDRKSKSMELFDTLRSATACLRVWDAISDIIPGR